MDLTLPLRGVQFLLNIIAMGLIGHVVDFFSDSPSRVSFFLFTTIWTLFALVFLIAVPRFMPNMAKPLLLLPIEVVTVIFWFAAWVALAAWIADVDDLGCPNWCRVTRAAVVFGAFENLLWIVTAVLTALKAFRSGGAANKPAAGTGPSMSV